MVIICCSTHTSWGQDSVNISDPSSLPAKSEVTHEDILNHAQRSWDRSTDLFNTIATVMGVFVGLISLLIILGGIFGYIEISRLKELNKEAEGYVKQIENKLKDAEKIVDKSKEVESVVKPVRDRFEQIEKNAKKSLDDLRERAKDFPSLPEPFSEDQKRILDEYGKKTEFVEAFGVPLKPEDYFNRGTEFYHRGEYVLALKAMDKAIELNPDYVLAWNNKGVALEKPGHYEEVLKAYDKAIELKPDFAVAWHGRGFALQTLGRLEEALIAYDKAIELKPDFAEALTNKGVALQTLGRLEEALKACDRAIKLNPDYVEVWNNKGLALGKLGRYEEALIAHDKAIELKPEDASTWYNKACTYSWKDDKENTLKNLSKATDLDAKFKEMAKSDADFKNFWADEDFKKIVS
jgi:tetratricopeptide (TPR) repeat protein